MISKIISENSIQQARKKIDEAQRIVITGHVSPDGDALGASLAMCLFLRKYGKQVKVLLPDSFPSTYNWLEGANEILIFSEKTDEGKRIIRESDLIFVLDYNTPSRIDCMADSIFSVAAYKIMVDHHTFPDKFCDLMISHPEISSTCEMVFRLICRMGFFAYIDEKIAECIYTGMMTDTGNFTYNSNSPEIYTIIAELIRRGMNKDLVYEKIFGHQSETRLRMLGEIFNNHFKIYGDCGVALIWLSGRDKKAFPISEKGDTEGFVNMPLTIDGVVMSVFAHEEQGYTKVSLRSRGDFAVNEVASQYYGGGGHQNASGGKAMMSVEEMITQFEKEVLPSYRERLIICKNLYTMRKTK